MLNLKLFSDASTIIIGFFLVDVLLYLSNGNVLCDNVPYHMHIDNGKDVIKSHSKLIQIESFNHSSSTKNNRKSIRDGRTRLTNSYYDNEPIYNVTNSNGYSAMTPLLITPVASPLSTYLSIPNRNYVKTNNLSHHNQLYNCHQSSTVTTTTTPGLSFGNAITAADNKINEYKSLNVLSVDGRKIAQTNCVNKINDTNYVNLTSEKYDKRHRRHVINDNRSGGSSSSSSISSGDGVTVNITSDKINNFPENGATTMTTSSAATISSVNVFAGSNVVEKHGTGMEESDVSNNGEYMIDNGDTFGSYENYTCTDDSCINHNITCVGEPQYCNYTYDEYVEMLYDYIYPTVPEWILIATHAVVFFMGLVSGLIKFCFHNNMYMYVV